ncbi:MAG: hypothetical protein KJZ96_07185 [Rhodocyclaceae bacterium]|nr:hypothetical protein [Rhodocyclaceae bacterium]MCL4758116.1 hypothetical protein [Rhodocyclaceae bacterium]
MRTFLALVIVLCVVCGLYLLQGPDFWWPDRGDPSHATRLTGLSSRLLGLALLTTASLGWMAARQAGHRAGRAASRAWQITYFLLLVTVIGLVSVALQLGEHGPNPESRAHSSPR